MKRCEIGQRRRGPKAAAGALTALGLLPQFFCTGGKEIKVYAANSHFVAHRDGPLVVYFFAVDGHAAPAAQGVNGPQAVLIPLHGGVLAGDGGQREHNVAGSGPADDVFPVVQRKFCAVGQAEKAPVLFLRPAAQQRGGAAPDDEHCQHGNQHM